MAGHEWYKGPLVPFLELLIYMIIKARITKTRMVCQFITELIPSRYGLYLSCCISLSTNYTLKWGHLCNADTIHYYVAYYQRENYKAMIAMSI